jgi:hypothetical protein
VLALLLVGLALAACERDRAPPDGPARAFYFWRTRLDLSPSEREALARLHVTRLLVRFFDVAWSAEAATPRPVAVVALAPGAVPAGVEVVPVVFLRAEVFERIAAPELPALAERVARQVRAVADAAGLPIRELQLDCDWTERSRESYFGFLAALRHLAEPSGLALSATIRLHQVKYRERTGVPPVERGMLMFYNVARLEAGAEAPSIFDRAAAARYTARIHEYPLPLDVALPVWAWAVHERGHEVVGLLQNVDAAALISTGWLRGTGPNRFVASRTAFLHGELVREGDTLRVESAGREEARAAADLVAESLRAGRRTATVALFDLSERNLRRHGEHDLDALFLRFR